MALAGLLFVAYVLSWLGKSTVRGIRNAGKKTRKVYEEELKELDSQTGKNPAGTYAAMGKALADKAGEHIAPKHAKNRKQVDNSKWVPVINIDKLTEATQKFLDGLGKLFSK